jgi:hypothetical protein
MRLNLNCKINRIIIINPNIFYIIINLFLLEKPQFCKIDRPVGLVYE